jgi:hypothetical protein
VRNSYRAMLLDVPRDLARARARLLRVERRRRGNRRAAGRRPRGGRPCWSGCGLVSGEGMTVFAAAFRIFQATAYRDRYGGIGMLAQQGTGSAPGVAAGC